MKVLCFEEPAQDIKNHYKGAQFVVQPVVDDSLPKDFDAIVSFHNLQHFPQTKVLSTLRDWKTYLKPGGELMVLVPSLEWASKLIIQGVVNPLVLPAIYGLLGENRTGFTMPILRRFFELAEINVTAARSGSYTVDTSQGSFQGEQHLVRGVI